jgi:putative transferase (TIGR04331 family)
MNLILGKLPKSFNPDTDLPIALHCLIGCEENIKKIANISFPDLTAINNKLLFIDEVTAKESLYLTQKIAKRYNAEIYEMHSERFWQFIYYPLVALIYQNVYARQIYFENFLEEDWSYKKFEVEIESNDFVWVCNDDYAVIELLRRVDFSAWVYSRLFEKRKDPRFNCIPKKKYGSSTITKIVMDGEQSSRKFKFINKFGIKYIYGFSFFDLMLFNLLAIFFKKKKIIREKSVTETSNSKLNSMLDIESLIDKILPNNYKNIAFIKRVGKSSRIFDFSNLLYYYYDAKIEAANAYENGDIILTNQHGGHNYGSALTFEFNRYIEYDVDYHLTWGSTSYINKTNAIFLKLPSPLLSRYLDKHTTVNNKIIWVGTAMFVIPFRFDSFFWTIAHNYRKFKEGILLTLANSEFGEHLFYRPYTGGKNCCLSDEDYFRTVISDIKILKGNFHKELTKCALLVLDHPGTTLNIAMAMNTPFLLVWKKEWFPFNKEADLYLDRFRELGIFFEDSTLLLEQIIFIKKEYGTFYNWWKNNVNVQKLRKEWMSKYAMADKGWRFQWIRQYWNL